MGDNEDRLRLIKSSVQVVVSRIRDVVANGMNEDAVQCESSPRKRLNLRLTKNEDDSISCFSDPRLYVNNERSAIHYAYHAPRPSDDAESSLAVSQPLPGLL